MMEKSALAGEGGLCTPAPFQPMTITYKVAEYATAEWADTLNLFPLYQYMYSHYPVRRATRLYVLPDLAGGAELPVPVAHALALLGQTLNVADVRLAVQHPATNKKLLPFETKNFVDFF
jgi:hypothetical protein